MVGQTDMGARRGHDELVVWLEAVAENRDRDAFARLFSHYAPRIKGFYRKGGVDGTTAEELTQEVMVTIWRKATQFDRTKASAGTWIYAIARNKRIDAIRRERRPEIDPTDPLMEPDPIPTPENELERSEWAAKIRDLIEVLPEEQAEVLRMAFFEEKTHSAIAEELDLPLGTVKSRVRLALGRLRLGLEDSE